MQLPAESPSCVSTYQHAAAALHGRRFEFAAFSLPPGQIIPPPHALLLCSHRPRRYKAYSLSSCVVLRNKPPRWNQGLGAYCLNFGGRVTQASVKNFQLVSVDNMVGGAAAAWRPALRRAWLQPGCQLTSGAHYLQAVHAGHWEPTCTSQA